MHRASSLGSLHNNDAVAIVGGGPAPSSPSIFFGKPGVSIGTSMSSSSRNVV